MADTFNLVVWYGESYGYEMRDVEAQSAIDGARRIINSVGGKTGIVTKIMITDSGDCCAFHWEHGKGIIFPTKEQINECQPPNA